ncbi:hypothetical protein [Leifsonia soli]|uniref:Lysylphosphatidylglycerol synthetase-like protein (DUF2156 family) n=1 Tax=Leifsonia soli TaxID=582665 RepID=A0A852T2E1_9MICO|nr:hypothetical protein [Leifsonia soli]NYD74854.1 lysylphosphatidylglycerol synthetase-like protein (DUF2156 family) [Leifsonia soli]
MSASAAAVSPAAHLRRRSREALAALAVQYLLGMAANLIGEPDSTFVRVVDAIIIILHVLIAIGLVVVSVRVLLAARAAGVGERLAVWGLVVMVISLLAGVLTISIGSDWASYVMAAGFLVAAALYAGTFLASYRLDRAASA